MLQPTSVLANANISTSVGSTKKRTSPLMDHQVPWRSPDGPIPSLLGKLSFHFHWIEKFLKETPWITYSRYTSLPPKLQMSTSLFTASFVLAVLFLKHMTMLDSISMGMGMELDRNSPPLLGIVSCAVDHQIGRKYFTFGKLTCLCIFYQLYFYCYCCMTLQWTFLSSA